MTAPLRSLPALVEGNGRKPDVRTEAADARLDTRVARLEHRTDLNDLRSYIRPLAESFYLGNIDRGLQLVGDLDHDLRKRLDKLTARS